MFVWIKRGFLPLAILGLLFTGAAQAQAPDRIKVLIGFDRTPGAADEALVRGLGGTVKYRYHLVPAIAASIPEKAMAALLRSPRVTSVTLDGTVQAIDHELANTWGVERVGAGEVHIGGNMGAGVSVAVIDSGIDYSHPELIGPYMGGQDFVNDDGDPMDDNGHGTHVSGTIAATIAAVGDHTGVVGMAPGVSLYGLKVLSASGSGYWSDIIAALQWAVDNDIDITNNSYGSSGNPGSTVEQAFINSFSAGVLHIAAAGNAGNCGGKGNNVGYPARYASVVAVAATNSSDSRPCFSSTGPDVELAAPGVYINSTVPGVGYAVWSGTSMASPHVAGAAALIIASSGDPLISNADVRQRLADTAIDLGASGPDNQYGYGLIDVVAATEVPGPDDLSPEVTMTSPIPMEVGSISGETVVVAADVWDDYGDVQVQFFVDNAWIAAGTEEGAGGWSAIWDTTGVCNGDHTVSATATDTSVQTSTDSVLVNLANDPDACPEPEPNKPPSISAQSFAVDENSLSGDVVGTVLASDPDGDSLTFAITGTAFAIDSNGQLTVADSAALDFETTPSFALTVRVTDPDGLFDEATVTVDLNDVVEGIITLSATKKGKFNRKGQKIQLQWSGAVGASVDIWRGTSKIANTANDGAYNDTVTEKKTYIYKVCDTSACSDPYSISVN